MSSRGAASASAAVWDEDARAALVAQARRVLRGPDPEDRAVSPRPRRGGRVHAGMPLSRLLAALARVGWGPMRGRAMAASRAILDTLALAARDVRADLTATIQVTARQLAKLAGYSLRHTSRCLQWMEDAGVIEWVRGGIKRVDGRPAPTVGVIRVAKKVITGWVLSFRAASDAEDRARNAATRARLEHYRVWRNRAHPKTVTVAAHVDMSSPHPSLRDEGASDAAPRPSRRTVIPSSKTKETTMNSNLNLPDPEFLPLGRGPGADAPRGANACKSAGCPRPQAAARALERVERERAAEAARKEELARRLPTPFEEYMRDTYPDATPRQWGRLALDDPEARRIARECAR